MTDPRQGWIPVVNELLDRLNASYGGDLTDHLGTTWRIELGQVLFDAWADGYTTGFANQEGFTETVRTVTAPIVGQTVHYALDGEACRVVTVTEVYPRRRCTLALKVGGTTQFLWNVEHDRSHGNGTWHDACEGATA